MANYATLKAALDAAIYTNTQRAITGNLLNSKLDEMINALGAGYQYMGEATPSTNPGSPDSNVVYLATTAGTYTNFDDLTLASGKIAFLRWNGTWAKDEISVQAELTIDSQPTSGSGNPVSSGGVHAALQDKQDTIEGVDVTVDNNTGTPYATGLMSGNKMVVAFHNIKGATGEKGATGATGPQGPQGLQGNPGSSQDYPFELENDPTKGGASKAATAESVKTIHNILIAPDQYTFELGTISNAGAESANAARVRSSYIAARREYIVSCDTTYQFSIRWYDEAKTFLGATDLGWVNEVKFSEHIMEGTAFFRIVAKLTSGANISDAASYNTYIHTYYPSPTLSADNVDIKYLRDALQVKKLQYNLTEGKIIDARADNANFDQWLNQSGWGYSQYVNLTGAKYVRMYRNINSTASNAAHSGVIFYDKYMTPFTTDIRKVIYSNSAEAFSAWDEFAIPEGAVYLRVSVSLATAAAYAYGIELYAISPKEIAGLQENVRPYSYAGEKIDLSQNAYNWHEVFLVAGGSQSAAIYGKYALFINTNFAKLVMVDMETANTLATCNTGQETESIFHCNQSQFGLAKYDDADLFPLLYTCTQNNEAGRCEWRVYRINPTLTDGEVSAFTVSLVQTIYLPVLNDTNCLGNANPAIDFENSCIWAYSRNNNTEADNYLKARFTKFSIPAITNPSVVLSDSDILDAFSCDWTMQYAQGGFIHRGKLYFAQGGPSYPNTVLRVVDLYAQRKQVSLVDLAAAGFAQEPEGVFMYDGKIYIHTNSGRLCRLDL